MDLQCSNVVILPDGFGEITVPTLSFNVIYILSHLYRHVFTEGIGLRQLLDYYFVIEKFFSKQSYHNSFSKTHPSSLTLKGGSTAFPKPLSPHGTGDVNRSYSSLGNTTFYGRRGIRALAWICGMGPLGDMYKL